MLHSFMLEARTKAVMNGIGSLWELLNQLQGGARPQNAAFVALAAWGL